MIVGFPGETEKNFQNTVQLIKRLPFSYLHVFSYSKRPGTKAAQFADQVDPKIIKERSEILRQIANQKKRAFYLSRVGKLERVLWEEKIKNNLMSGLTDNYIKVCSRENKNLTNKLLLVKLIDIGGGGVWGELVNASG